MKTNATVAILVALTSSFSSAQDKTFAGRTFDEWKVLVRSDLDPQTRAQAMSAIGVFAHHGHRQEAIEILGRAVATESDDTVVRSGYNAVLSLGADGAEVILAGLKAKDDGKRRIALTAFSSFISPRRLAESKIELGTLPKKVIPQLLVLMKDPDVSAANRITATKALERVLRLRDPEEFAENVLEALKELIKSDEIELSVEAIRTVGQLGEHARDCIPLLVEFVEQNEPLQRTSDGQNMVSRQMYAVIALASLGPIAEDAIPALEKAQKTAFEPRGLTPRMIQSAIKSIRGEK